MCTLKNICFSLLLLPGFLLHLGRIVGGDSQTSVSLLVKFTAKTKHSVLICLKAQIASITLVLIRVHNLDVSCCRAEQALIPGRQSGDV